MNPVERAMASTRNIGGVVKSTAAELPPLFIEGYFTKRFEAGEQPNYGYPKNHLPETTGELKVATAFLSPRPSK